MQRSVLIALALVASMGLGLAQDSYTGYASNTYPPTAEYGSVYDSKSSSYPSSYPESTSYSSSSYPSVDYEYKKVPKIKCVKLQEIIGAWEGGCIQTASINTLVRRAPGQPLVGPSTPAALADRLSEFVASLRGVTTGPGGGVVFPEAISPVSPTFPPLTCMPQGTTITVPYTTSFSLLNGGSSYGYGKNVEVLQTFTTPDVVTTNYPGFNGSATIPATRGEIILYPRFSGESCCIEARDRTTREVIRFNMFIEEYYGQQHLILELVLRLPDQDTTDYCPKPSSPHFCTPGPNGRFYARCDLTRVGAYNKPNSYGSSSYGSSSYGSGNTYQSYP